MSIIQLEFKIDPRIVGVLNKTIKMMIMNFVINREIRDQNANNPFWGIMKILLPIRKEQEKSMLRLAK